MVERALIAPPVSRMGPLTPDERRALLRASPIAGKYEQTLDRESAFEQIAQRTAAATQARAAAGTGRRALGPGASRARKRGRAASRNR